MTFSTLYAGMVRHKRFKPRTHALAYRVFSLLVDLDELPALDRELRLFSYNRRGPIAFHDRDHGPGDGRPLRGFVEHQLARAGIEIGGGAIRLLCTPRVFGYVFNPLSVYFCYRPDDTLAAILYEVSNTFHQRHWYLFPIARDEHAPFRHACDKAFYVSPFIDMAARYHFTVVPPGERVTVSIAQSDPEGPLLYAALEAGSLALTDRGLLRVLASYPLITWKIVLGIHWEALLLWLKGVPLVPRPAPPAEPVSIIVRPPPPNAL